MLSEKECNKFIKDILDWGYKIPDSDSRTKNTVIKRCFDGFGVAEGIPIYWESKYFSEPKKTISHKELFGRKHQVENLISIYDSFRKKPSITTNCLTIYCVFMRVEARKVKVFTISNPWLKDMYFSNKKSYSIEEITEVSRGSTILSTNLEADTNEIDIWKLLDPRG